MYIALRTDPAVWNVYSSTYFLPEFCELSDKKLVSSASDGSDGST